MTTPTPTPEPASDLAALFPAEPTAAEQALIDRHHHLTEALARLREVPRRPQRGGPDPVHLTARIIDAARELATATRPLIEHLPAITAALVDAADYRGEDGGWCADCVRAPAGTPCGDHANDQAIATAYENALHAITG
jgi:hypothetical protein